MKTIAAILTLAAVACAAEPKVHRGLPYAEPGSELQTLDVYAPAAAGQNLPVVVWIHGGGWHRGDKADVEKKPQALVDKGFVFVSINYRLFPAVTIKQIAADVAKAIRWTRDHIREYGGDPRAIVVMGHSAGAQLAALVCTDDGYLKAEGMPLSAIKACVPVDGDSYDVPMQIKAVEEGPEASYTLTFGDPAKQRKLPTITLRAKGKRAASCRIKFGDEALQRELSAVTHVAKGKHIPPFLVLHVADHPETKAQSQRLVKALVEAGVPATAYPATGKNHATINADLGLPDDRPTREILAFLGAVLKGTNKTQAPSPPAPLPPTTSWCPERGVLLEPLNKQ
jgi:acetyl esterase/lipase